MCIIVKRKLRFHIIWNTSSFSLRVHMHGGKQVPGSLRQYVDIFVLMQRPSAYTHAFKNRPFNEPSAATTRFSLYTEGCSMYSQAYHSALFFRDKIILLHTSTQTRLRPVAKHALYRAAYCCMDNKLNHTPRRGRVFNKQSTPHACP